MTGRISPEYAGASGYLPEHTLPAKALAHGIFQARCKIYRFTDSGVFHTII